MRATHLSPQVLEMTTTWEGGVEVAAVVALVTEGGEVQVLVVTEMAPLEEEQQTSENHLKVTSLPVCKSYLLLSLLNLIVFWLSAD